MTKNRRHRLYAGALKINADGHPQAYHPKDEGIDYLDNAHKADDWWGVVTVDGKPFINPKTGYYVSTTSLQNYDLPTTDQRRYVHSGQVPFIVVPDDISSCIGCLAYVVDTETGNSCGAIVADIGPEIGEVSMFLADQLDIDSDPKTGGCDNESRFQYYIFDTERFAWPQDVATILRKSQQFYNEL